jgi:predicted O-methyltransferase YrrM
VPVDGCEFLVPKELSDLRWLTRVLGGEAVLITRFNDYRAIWWRKVVTAFRAIKTRAYAAVGRPIVTHSVRDTEQDKDLPQTEIGMTEGDEIEFLINSLNPTYLWQGSQTKAMFEESGIQLVRGDYYSPIPTVKEIEASWELRGGAMPYLEPELYDNEFMLKFLNDCLSPYAKEFDAPVEATTNPAQFYWRNSEFSYSDALAYYCMIRYQKPRRIIEVGAGYSSLIAAQALQDNGSGELVLIEPYPSERLKLATQRDLLSPKPYMVEDPVQDVPVSFFRDSLGEGDILFIDSTHTVKCGGDCVFIYLKVLPKLRDGVVIHVHDAFLPQMMPAHWLTEFDFYWTEQYLLQAYLLDNQKAKILFGSNYHYLLNGGALESFMGGKYGAGGGSFWFQKRKMESAAG